MLQRHPWKDLEAEAGGAPESGNRALAGLMWWKIEGPNANRNVDNGDHTYELSDRNRDLGIGVKTIYYLLVKTLTLCCP